jgi:DNA invertase Pin-like site-specific DNA recombinase
MSFLHGHPHTADGAIGQAAEPGKSSNTVLVRLGKRKVEIDKTIAPVIMELWKAGMLNLDDVPLQGPAEQAAGNAVYGYVRASTDKQENTVKIQKADIEKRFVDERCKNLRHGGILQDPETSSGVPLVRRQAGRELVRRLRPGDHLVITSFDRAFRNFGEAVHWIERWLKHGITLHILRCRGIDTATPMGRAFLRMMAVFAELERDMIRERTRAGMNCPEVKAKMASRKTRGKLTGRGGIGYVTKGARGRRYREEHPGEQAAIQLIIGWREAEKMSWSEIALRLMREKHLTKDGKIWQPWRCRMAYLSVPAARGVRASVSAQAAATSQAVTRNET